MGFDKSENNSKSRGSRGSRTTRGGRSTNQWASSGVKNQASNGSGSRYANASGSGGNGSGGKNGGPSRGGGGSRGGGSGRRKRGPGRIIGRLVLLFVAAAVVFIGVFTALVELTPFDASKLTLSSQPTIIYDKYGKEYSTISAPGESDLPYSDIPTNLQNALVATEDHSFWNSSSVDIRGIFRAAFVDLWRGSLAQGGSTIQEQLAKMVYLTDKKTFSRKFQQVLLGVQINRYFSKQEILAMYLNRVYLGEGTTGVKEAAMKYFGVDLSKNKNQLTLAQAALLAGLPQAPSAYDPLQHPKAALARRNQVLENMAKYGYITEAKAQATEKLPLGVSVHPLSGDIWTEHPLMAQFLMDYADKNGISSQLLAQGGLKIYTTIDPQVESAIEQVFGNSQYASHFAAPVNGEQVPAAAVFVDPSTGAILGAAGARDATAARGLDRAYEYGQPGSSIKPILDYGPAIENGTITPDSILNNQPHDFGGGYFPHNDAPNQPTQVTARYALANSENVAAVSLLQKIGISTGVAFAEQDGIQFTAKDKTELGIAIGGMQKGVNAVQMAQGYEAFDNQGIQQQTYLIGRIVNQQGDTIYKFQPAAKRIMSSQTAATMTSMMEGVVQSGTGTGAVVPGWGVAGKTGTVQYDAGLSGPNSTWIRLAWFDGYTPNMVGSIYMGWNYDQSSPAYHMTGAPSYQCSQIFGDIVRLAEQGKTPQNFQGTQPPPSTNDAAAVTNLQATWNQSANGVQLSWQSDVAGQAQFVITRQDASGGPGAGGPGANGVGNMGFNGPGAGGPGAGGPAGKHGHGRHGHGVSLVIGGANATGVTGVSSLGGASPSTGASSQLAQLVAYAPGTAEIGRTNNLNFVDTSVAIGGVYTYTVQAVDLNSGQPIGQPASITISVNMSGSGNQGNTTDNSPGGLGGTNNGTINNNTGGTGTGGTTNDTGGTGTGTGTDNSAGGTVTGNTSSGTNGGTNGGTSGTGSDTGSGSGGGGT